MKQYKIHIKYGVISLITLGLFCAVFLNINPTTNKPAILGVSTNSTQGPQIAQKPTFTPSGSISTVFVPEPPAPEKKPNTIANQTKPSPAKKNITISNQNVSAQCKGSFSQQFLCLLNNYRSEEGKSKLKYDSSLNKVASSYAKTMAETGNFSHTGLDGSRLTERCNAFGTKCNGENLAHGFSSASELFSMWQSSPGHNENLLRDFSVVGLGISNGYATLLFR
jgi:uncharacterized protein YkwD